MANNLAQNSVIVPQLNTVTRCLNSKPATQK